jgi:DNA-directed RNA polymerase subunit RPC12/RpoP
MKDARNNGSLVVAGVDAPREAICPSCGGRVVLRHRRDTGTFFYRHARGEGLHCPRRPRVGGVL